MKKTKIFIVVTLKLDNLIWKDQEYTGENNKPRGVTSLVKKK